MNRNPAYDTPEFRKLWYSTKTLEEIGQRYGVSAVSIHKAAMCRGWHCRHVFKWHNRMKGIPNEMATD